MLASRQMVFLPPPSLKIFIVPIYALCSSASASVVLQHQLLLVNLVIWHQLFSPNARMRRNMDKKICVLHNGKCGVRSTTFHFSFSITNNQIHSKTLRTCRPSLQREDKLDKLYVAVRFHTKPLPVQTASEGQKILKTWH